MGKERQKVTFIVTAVFSEGDAGYVKRQTRKVRSDIKTIIQSNPGMKILSINSKQG